MQRTPVEKIIRIGTLVLMALWLGAYFLPASMQGWPALAMLVIAVVLYLAVALELYQVITRIRQGHLYFLRTVSFYTNIGIIAVVAVVYLSDFFVNGQLTGGWQMPFVLLVLMLAYFTQTFSYLYLDSVRLTHRLGTATTTIPLFAIAEVKEEETGLTVTAENGTEIYIDEGSLPKAQFATVRSRLLPQ